MMKLIKRLLFAFAISSLFVACTQNETEGDALLKPIFDEPLELSFVEGESKEINFTTDTDWKLVSGAIWCKLSLDGENYSFSVMGAKGDNRVFVSVNDAAADFSESSTDVKLIRGSNEEIAAVVTRAPKEFALSLSSGEDKQLQNIEIAENGSLTVNVEANFNFGITEYPEWLSELVVTKGDDDGKKLVLKVLPEFEPYECSGQIKFEDEGGNVSYLFDVIFAGMNRHKIVIEGEGSDGWTLSSDGVTFKNKAPLTGKEIIKENGVEYSIKAFNYDCNYLFFEQQGDNLLLIDAADSWLKVEKNTENPAVVTVVGEPYPENLEGVRQGCIVAVAAADCDSIMGLYNAAPDASFLDLVHDNLLINVTQVSDYVDLTKGFRTFVGMDTPAECFVENDQSIISLINSKYNVSEIYAMSVEEGIRITAYTNLVDSDWAGYKPENIIILDASCNVINDPRAAIGFELAMNESDEYYMSFIAQVTPVIVILRDDAGEYIKALVVKSSLVLNPGTGYEVKNMLTFENIACELETDEELAAMLVKRYGTKEIYTVSEKVGYFIYVYPQLSNDEWDVSSANALFVADVDGAIIPSNEVKLECGEDPETEEHFYAALMVKKRILVLVFVGRDGKNKKVLVVRPISE